MKKAIVLLMIFFILFSVNGQDIHFSQYKMAPVLINPAQAGFCFAKLRVTANHRSQWRAVSVPFNTFSLSTDFKIFQDRRARNLIGGALSTYYDNAGDSKFGTTSAGFALSYLLAVNDYHNHYIGFGASGSYNDRSYDYSLLVFGNQFNGERFDANLYNGENFLNRGFTYPDYNAGVHWFYRPDQDNAFDAGIVVSHINRPPQSMMDDTDVRLDRKFTFYFNAEVTQANKRILNPGLYIARQGPYTEIIAGSMMTLNEFSTGHGLSNLQAGLFFRPVDAAILIFNFDYHNITFGISYDINYSSLRPASTFRGGFELSALYMVQKKKKKKIKNIPCPDPF
ncbi:MAG: PorP/SprF family type IX secretion system membrane protein [Bacteroidales bacterium]